MPGQGPHMAQPQPSACTASGWQRQENRAMTAGRVSNTRARLWTSTGLATCAWSRPSEKEAPPTRRQDRHSTCMCAPCTGRRVLTRIINMLAGGLRQCLAAGGSPGAPADSCAQVQEEQGSEANWVQCDRCAASQHPWAAEHLHSNLCSPLSCMQAHRCHAHVSAAMQHGLEHLVAQPRPRHEHVLTRCT